MKENKSIISLLEATKKLHINTPALSNFVNWPDNLTYRPQESIHAPAATLVKNWESEGEDLEGQLHKIFSQNALCLKWVTQYKEEEVGADFLNNFGYVELYGPTGHFYSETHRGYILFLNQNQHYPWHNHEAEELYHVISGGGTFHVKDQTPLYKTRGESQIHLSFQHHALEQTHEPILAYVVWRGNGLDGHSSIESL